MGMMGNIMSTAAGVAVGSTVGHGLSSMCALPLPLALLFHSQAQLHLMTDPISFLVLRDTSRLFGGSARAEDVPAPVAQQAASEIADSGAQCAIQAKSFTQCLDATASDMQSCSYYFEALKACQQAAAPY